MADYLTHTTNEGDEAEMMSDKTLKRLLEYLKTLGWTDSEIIKLLDYITEK